MNIFSFIKNSDNKWVILSSLDFEVNVWKHLISTKLGLYISNTLILLLGVGLNSLFFGISTAWIIARYKFPFSTVFEWALILPLAIAAYIVAYCYTDLLDYSGFIQTSIRNI